MNGLENFITPRAIVIGGVLALFLYGASDLAAWWGLFQ